MAKKENRNRILAQVCRRYFGREGNECENTRLRSLANPDPASPLPSTLSAKYRSFTATCVFSVAQDKKIHCLNVLCRFFQYVFL